MSNQQRDPMRAMTIKLPNFRWSAVSSAGIVTTIATGQVQDPTTIWALVVLGVSANLGEVLAVGLAARGGTPGG
ncbi:hypothetical protein [Streptomyces sp. NBC_00199]|uniref:hypothetical protein n=1 Tax=Streptomyces sp. NBC_00199 TaxID=2975678 RepID=UPI0022540399|nr:hypothetical protein [Streptomyces sp. NBC_00199]MCX5266079.1 hypothetical protein [Streptomyces sp. NBC_00199]